MLLIILMGRGKNNAKQLFGILKGKVINDKVPVLDRRRIDKLINFLLNS